MSEEMIIKEKQRWIHRANGHTIRIMATSENWYMVRRKGGSPFCIYRSELIDKYYLSPQSNKLNNGKETNT